MNKIKNSSDADLDDVLWRFMSLDKFIDLLSTKELFFASINSFMHSDPLEGYLPKPFYDKRTDDINTINAQALKANTARRNSIVEKLKTAKKQKNQDDIKLYTQLIAGCDLVGKRFAERIKDLLKTNLEIFSTSKKINCWYSNPHESEAMWKLYSDGGKGIAIKTTVRRLLDSITTNEEIHFSDVLYLDYNANELNCNVKDANQPVKRLSYSHENEKRLYITAFTESDSLDLFKLFMDNNKPPTKEVIKGFARKFYTNSKIKIDLSTLIDEIYISPFSQEPFDSSIKAVCDIYRQNSELVDLPTPKKSNLLEGFDWGNYLSE